MFWAAAGRGFRAQRGCKNLKRTHKRWEAGKGKDRGREGKMQVYLQFLPTLLLPDRWTVHPSYLLKIFTYSKGKKERSVSTRHCWEDPPAVQPSPARPAFSLSFSSAAEPNQTLHTDPCCRYGDAPRALGHGQETVRHRSKPFPINSWNSAWKRNQKEKPETQEMMSLSVNHELYCDWYIYLSIHIYISIYI